MEDFEVLLVFELLPLYEGFVGELFLVAFGEDFVLVREHKQVVHAQNQRLVYVVVFCLFYLLYLNLQAVYCFYDDLIHLV